MSLLKKIKENLSPTKVKDDEKEFEQTLTANFAEAQNIIEQPDDKQTPAQIWIEQTKQLIVAINNQDFNDKLTELEAILTTYDKKIANYKGIIKKQSDFHKTNNQNIIDKSKRKSALIQEKDKELKQLNEAISIYKNIELRYHKILKELQSQQQIIEYSRKQLKR